MHTCGARMKIGGACSKEVSDKYTFCTIHRNKAERILARANERKENTIKMLWDDYTGLMEMYPDITLSQIFNYIQDMAIE